LRRDESLRALNLRVMRELGEQAGMRITASGGIAGLQDLLAVQELEPFGVDSVVVGRALYENRFSCQAVWRMCEAGRYPYTAKV
jgi:phosphoribosylformimino-5-aminoimidazole carboxamide ribotide isomerase